MRPADEAAPYARQRAASGEDMAASGYCLQFTRENYPVGAYYYSAIDAWNASEHQHPDGSPADGPPGYPGYWWSDNPYRHVAVCVGNNQHATVFNEEIVVLSAADMGYYFGSWIGWAEDLNAVYIPATANIPDEEEDEMRMIRRGTTNGTVSLIGAGWYVPLGNHSVEVFTDWLGKAPEIKAADYYDTVLACLIQGKTAAAAEILGHEAP